jgi:hypothetical protein
LGITEDSIINKKVCRFTIECGQQKKNKKGDFQAEKLTECAKHLLNILDLDRSRETEVGSETIHDFAFTGYCNSKLTIWSSNHFRALLKVVIHFVSVSMDSVRASDKRLIDCSSSILRVSYSLSPRWDTIMTERHVL